MLILIEGWHTYWNDFEFGILIHIFICLIFGRYWLDSVEDDWLVSIPTLTWL